MSGYTVQCQVHYSVRYSTASGMAQCQVRPSVRYDTVSGTVQCQELYSVGYGTVSVSMNQIAELPLNVRRHIFIYIILGRFK